MHRMSAWPTFSPGDTLVVPYPLIFFAKLVEAFEEEKKQTTFPNCTAALLRVDEREPP